MLVKIGGRCRWVMAFLVSKLGLVSSLCGGSNMSTQSRMQSAPTSLLFGFAYVYFLDVVHGSAWNEANTERRGHIITNVIPGGGDI